MDILSYIYPVAFVGSLIAVFLMSFKNGKKERVESSQQRTIEAQNTQIELLRNRLVDVEKENARVHLLLDTVISALAQDGKIITIDGNMVTIKDDEDNKIKPRRKTTVTKAIQATTTVKQESEKLS